MKIHLLTDRPEIKVKREQTINNINQTDTDLNERRIAIRKRFKDLFEKNHTIKGLEADIKLKPGTQIVQQKARPIPIHLQDAVGKELKRLIKKDTSKKPKI